MLISFGRVLIFGLQNFWRNLGLSLTTIAVLVLTLLSVNLVYIINVLADQAVASVSEQVDMSLYFKKEISMSEAKEVEKYIKSFQEVTETKLLSADEALKRFKEQYYSEPSVIKSLNELQDNPLTPILIVKTKAPTAYQKIILALDVPEYKKLVESKSFDDHSTMLNKINVITSQFEYLALVASVSFGVIAFLIIFNAIRIAIYSQRTEISIKKLVGASNWFIRGPYMIESVLFTVLSVGLTMALVGVALRWIDPYLAVVLPNGFSLTNYFYSNMLMLFGSQALAVLLLTVVSSALAMRKQLKV
jgi:cell division transport system permease protein